MDLFACCDQQWQHSSLFLSTSGSVLVKRVQTDSVVQWLPDSEALPSGTSLNILHTQANKQTHKHILCCVFSFNSHHAIRSPCPLLWEPLGKSQRFVSSFQLSQEDRITDARDTGEYYNRVIMKDRNAHNLSFICCSLPKFREPSHEVPSCMESDV